VTSAVFVGDPGSPNTYAMEIVAGSSSGERRVVWAETLRAPATEEERG